MKLYNNGLNFRDFTYIKDVVKILLKTLKISPFSKIINICRSKPIKTIHLVSLIKDIYKKNYKISKIGFIKGEMLKTHGSNKLLLKHIGRLSFTDIKVGINITIREFKKNNF